jgi:hypothetical protein
MKLPVVPVALPDHQVLPVIDGVALSVCELVAAMNA